MFKLVAFRKNKNINNNKTTKKKKIFKSNDKQRFSYNNKTIQQGQESRKEIRINVRF